VKVLGSKNSERSGKKETAWAANEVEQAATTAGVANVEEKEVSTARARAAKVV
jgi:hypothetical protein